MSRYKAIELVSEIEEAQEQHQLHRYMLRFASFDLVVIDERGHMPLSQHAADLLFQVSASATSEAASSSTPTYPSASGDRSSRPSGWPSRYPTASPTTLTSSR